MVVLYLVPATSAGLEDPREAESEVEGPRYTRAAPTIMFFFVNAIYFSPPENLN